MAPTRERDVPHRGQTERELLQCPETVRSRSIGDSEFVGSNPPPRFASGGHKHGTIMGSQRTLPKTYACIPPSDLPTGTRHFAYGFALCIGTVPCPGMLLEAYNSPQASRCCSPETQAPCRKDPSKLNATVRSSLDIAMFARRRPDIGFA